MIQIGLQRRHYLAVILLGPLDHQTGENAPDLLLGCVEAGGQLGELLGVVEAVDGIGAHPVGGMDQGGNVILVSDHAGGGVIYLPNGVVDFLFAESGGDDHQQTGKE